MDIGIQIFVFGLFAAAAFAIIFNALLDRQMTGRGLYRLDDPRHPDYGRRQKPH